MSVTDDVRLRLRAKSWWKDQTGPQCQKLRKDKNTHSAVAEMLAHTTALRSLRREVDYQSHKAATDASRM